MWDESKVTPAEFLKCGYSLSVKFRLNVIKIVG